MSVFTKVLESWTAADDFLSDKIDSIKTKVDSAIINYGFHINGNESNPSNAITYLGDAIGMIPAKMNYSSGTFDYGSWQNAFFMPKPCMLKSDGTVAYYLNPNDYTKKTDGTDSDVANEGFDGNAMMEWGEIWWMVLPDPLDVSSATVYISNTKLGEGYHSWSNIGLDGKHKEHFYTPIYNGSVVGTKLRSLSGKVPCMNKTAEQEIALAKANGDGWYTEVLCDCEIINWLLVLMGKSLDTQTVYGLGNQSGYVNDSSQNYGMINSGTMDDKGLFWGKNVSSASNNSGVKVFGMENYWGNQWRRIAGLINDKGTAKVKMCYGTSDGSTTTSYNLDGTGYVETSILPSNGYITKADYSKGVFVPKITGGSSSTYYCDYYYNKTETIYYLRRGGGCDYGACCGAFCLGLFSAASVSNWSFGAALSFKSL